MPRTRRVIYNAVGPGPGGELFGVASGGVFTVNTKTRRPRLLARYPGAINGGFAIRGGRVFFISGAQIVSFALPAAGE